MEKTMQKLTFNETILTDENVDKALMLHDMLAKELSHFKHIENVLQQAHPHKSEIIKVQQKVQSFLMAYFQARKDTSKQSVDNGEDLLSRRMFKRNRLDEDGNIIVPERVHIGLNFIHEQFNNNKLFPIQTFMTLVAGSGVGKSDYIYKIANSFLMQDYKVLLCSFEFGEDRLGTLLDSRENDGKDRMREARINGKFRDLKINYYARDLEALKLLILIAVEHGIKCILIDSFGEVERDGKSEYLLQQETAIALNALSNDYGVFIGLISQVKANEEQDAYTMRGGEDFKYKPDISLHISKLSPTDTSGERKVHLFKNREEDLNGKTIITKYNFETREIEFLRDFDGNLTNGEPVRQIPYKKKQ